MKKTLISLLTLIFVISGICFFGTDNREVLAAAGDVTTGDGFIAVEYDDLSDYRKTGENEAPTAPSTYAGYIFAGWPECFLILPASANSFRNAPSLTFPEKRAYRT